MKALAAKIGVKAAYEVLNLPRSRAYPQPKATSQGREKPVPALSDAERAELRALLNRERFMDKASRQVYAVLLDEGQYHCHWRTMYRLLSDYDEVHERRVLRQHPLYKKPELLATAPNQVCLGTLPPCAGRANGHITSSIPCWIFLVAMW